MKNDEGCTVACRERRYGFHHPVLRAWCLGRISGQEVIARLLRRQPRYGWQDTVCITSEHYNIARLSVDQARNSCVRDELDGICASRVFRDVHVVVVGFAIDRIVYNVLEDRAEPDGTVDLGFFLCGEVNAFGVAATLDVEYTAVRPHVLVVANELASRIGRKRCFPGT